MNTPRRGLALDALLTLIIALVVGGPLFATQDGFAVDFTNHLWLGWVQGHAIAHGLHPTYFTSTTTVGIFNPIYAFYGGTLYVALGALCAVLGGRAVVAYEIVIMASILAVCGGFVWLARQCGIRGLPAHVPGIVFVSSAYYVTDLYGRGDFPEFVAISMIPLVLASGAHLLRQVTWTSTGTLIFVLSVVIFTGSHNITLLWGTVILAVIAAALWFVCRSAVIPWRRIGGVVMLAILAGAVNAWFLLNDIIHANDIQAAHRLVPWSATSFLNTPGLLFDPLRHVPSLSGTPALYVQIPLWFLLWAIAALTWTHRRTSNTLLWRVGMVLGIVLTLLLLMIMTPQPWDLMPTVMRDIQFAYRLNSYVALVVGGLVLVGILAMQRLRGDSGAGERALRYGLAAAVCISLGLALWQLWIPNDRMNGRLESYVNRHEALIGTNVSPRTWYDTNSYADASQRVVAVPADRTLVIDPHLVSHDRISATLTVPPGLQPIATNVVAGPYLASINGLERLGRTSGGFAVVRRVIPGSKPVHVVIKTASSASIVIGRLVSIIALIGLGFLLVLTRRQGLRSLELRQ